MLKKIGIRSRLIAAMLCACLIPLSIVGYVAQQKAGVSLKAQAFNQLETVREVKKAHVEQYFESIRHQVLTFSQSRMIVEAMSEFDAAFTRLPEELDSSPQALDTYRDRVENYYSSQFGQEFVSRTGSDVSVSGLVPDSPAGTIAQYLYIANNANPLGSKEALDYSADSSTYSQYHKKYHPIIRSYLEKFGYYDIFLISPEKGEIVYSVFKEIDYATSLKSGPHSSTNFARVVEQAIGAGRENAVELVDFEPYMPSFNSPASFVSSPIYDDNKLIGVLVFQMPVATIDGIMQVRAGLGVSGETYLLGSDGFMRSQSSFSEENTILDRKVDTEATDALKSGESGSAMLVNYSGEAALSSFSPIAVQGLNWGIVAEIDEAEAMGSVAALRSNILYITIGGLGLALALGFVFGNILYQQLGTEPRVLLEVADAVANDRYDVQIDSRKPLRGVFAGMVAMQQKLKVGQEESSRRTGRIQEALDKATGNIMVTDENLAVIYVNAAARKLFNEASSEVRKVYSDFDPGRMEGLDVDLIYDAANQRKGELVRLSSEKKDEFKFGNRTFGVITNPVLSGEGKLIGLVMEWEDRTQIIATQEEVQSIVNEALKGNLAERIDLKNKSGFFETLSKGVNDLVSIADQVIRETVTVLSAMSGGNLTKTIDSEYEGAFAELKQDANLTVEKLTSVVGEIQQAARNVKSGADEIATGNSTLNQRTEQQASNLGKTASSMEELTNTVKQNAQNAAEADQLAKEVREQAEKGGLVVKDAVEAMNEINSSSKQISDIIGVIDEIAFQTNLLALNAAVEAARAGDQGRGFAVVASEVRNLAGRSATAAKEIKDLIQDSSSKVNDGSKLVNKSGTTLEEIVIGVKKVTDLVGEIASASREQSIGLDHINTAIAQIDVLTQQNASLVEESTAASRLLGDQASGLGSLVSFFKTSESTNFNAAVPKTEHIHSSASAEESSVLESQEKMLRDLMASAAVGSDQDWEEF